MSSKGKMLPAKAAADEPAKNGWDQLALLLDPSLVKAPRLEAAWKRLHPAMVTYLVNLAAKHNPPWLNHLALAGVIYSESGAVRPTGVLPALKSFLYWAIPTYYAELAALNPAEALGAYFGDPPRPYGEQVWAAYHSQQLYMQQYLGTLTVAERKRLEPFLLPPLLDTPKLSKLMTHLNNTRRARRKEQAYAVVRDLVSLVAMGRQRYQWLVELDAQVQHVAQAVRGGQATLPAVIKGYDLDHKEIVFRIWDRVSWVEAHRDKYGKAANRRWAYPKIGLFLQLVGQMPATPWFLHAVEVGAFNGNPSPMAQQYLKDHRTLLFDGKDGLLKPTHAPAALASWAQGKISGEPDDTRVLFWVEPFLAGAALGLFTLVSLTQTAMRIGELQQLTFDEECIQIGHFPQFEQGQPEEQMFWRLYPKGKTKREPYAVTPLMQEALAVWMQTHERFCGPWKAVPTEAIQFSHARQFPGRHKFAFQWKGTNLRRQTVESCLEFLLLEHTCLDSSGQPTRITAHVLRHGVAGYLRNQGIPLEEIMALLKQVNLVVTDYYSQLSPQDLYRKIGPALTRLGELAEIDPATLRTVDDLNRLAQAALKRFGVLSQLPGGNCSSFESCELQFRCAACAAFVPDPARRGEVENKIAVCQKSIQWFEGEGDSIQASNQRSYLHSWERILKEMDALTAVQIETGPLSQMLSDAGVNSASHPLAVFLDLPAKVLPGGQAHA